MRMLWAVSFVGKSKAHENGVVLSCWERRLLTWAVGDAHVKGMIEYSCHWVGRRANHRHCSTLVGPNLPVGPNHELLSYLDSRYFEPKNRDIFFSRVELHVLRV